MSFLSDPSVLDDFLLRSETNNSWSEMQYTRTTEGSYYVITITNVNKF